MRVAYANKRLEELARQRKSKHYAPQLARRILMFVDFAMSASGEQDLRAMASFRYHDLKGEREGQRAVKLSGNWRLIVTIERQDNGETVVLLDVVDYH